MAMIAPARTEPKTVRCGVYTRKSVVEGLDQDFNTLDAQREAGEAYIASQKGNGWVCLPDRYDDGGFTGSNIDRPALANLMADIEAGLVDCVVVYKVDRLSRSLLDFSRLVEVFDRYGVSFVSVTQPINTADSTGRLMLNILLSFAQFERETIADRTRDKVCAARRRGKWTGGIPVLGYDVHPDGGKLVVNEDEAPMVREVFQLYLKHRSLQKVVAELNRRGWTTKSWTTKKGQVRESKHFTKSNLSRLLANPVYIGCVKLKGQVYDGEHSGIIRKATFDKVQTILNDNHVSRGNKARNKYNHLLKGLIRCGACGTAYIPNTTRKGPRVYRYYTCSGAQKNGWKSCPLPNIPANDLEHLIVQQIRVIGSDPKLQAATIKQVRKTAREQKTALDSESKRLRSSREKIGKETAGLLQALAGGEATGASISGRLAQLEEQATKLDTRLAEIERERRVAEQSTLDLNDLTSALSLFDPIWDVLFPAEQTRIIELLIRQIEYNGKSGKLAITFHPTGIKSLANEMVQTKDGST
ncbi:MAG: recombinase family protein [Spirochaetales bacterium]|nr:recombinase family protein [Spirochaetales bacterium]